ncbi:MAG: metallophosphoesterase [Desertifilum sp.]|nr:metallophosphoesterase [Desertifilum sp.]
MRIAIISDIHGNWEGLKVVLQDIKLQSIDKVVCLGDLVEGGEHNDAVVEFIRENNIATVQGNHDEFNDCQLKQDNQKWLKELPDLLIENNYIFTHISPRLKKCAISNSIEAWNVFDEVSFQVCFIGHIHFPALFGAQHDEFGEACSYFVDSGKFVLNTQDSYIVSFGAIGYSRGGGKFVRYGIFDAAENTVEFIKLEGPLLPYGLSI